MYFKTDSGNGFNWKSAGDVAAYNFTKTSFTTDSSWRDLDLSSIIGAKHCLVHIELRIESGTVELYFGFRKNGNSNSFNKAGQYTQVSNRPIFADLWVETDTAGKVEYNGSSGTWTSIDVTVKDWVEL